MITANTVSQRIAATVVALLGLVLAVRSLWHVPFIDLAMPSARFFGPNTPLMFVAAGLFLYGSTVPRFRQGRALAVSRILLLLIGALSMLILAEHVFHVSLGVDFAPNASAPTPETPTPGRVAPNTCVAFLLAAVSLYLASMPARPRWQSRTMVVASAGVMLISMTALAGHFLQLSSLYQFASYNRMLAPTAAGLFILGIGLWFKMQDLLDREDQSVDAFESRITRRSAGILALVAISTGVAGFSIVEAGVDNSSSQNLLDTAVTNGAAVAATLEARLWFSQTAQHRPSVIHAYTILAHNPADAQARALLREVGESLLPTGVRNIRFLDANGLTISEAGQALAADGTMRMPLNPSEQVATLLWRDGFYLHTENMVVIDDRFVGKIVMEQALTGFRNQITEIEKSSASTEVLICGRTTTHVLCAPSRFYPKPRTIPLYKADGTVNLPFMPTELNVAKVSRIKDLRGVPSVIAYTPIRNFGLGLVLKVDADSLYASIRTYVLQLIAVIVVLVGLGALIARLQIRPLLARLVYEQTRNQAILAGSNDAFIAMDSDGRVTDWNARAEALFHWPAEEATGQLLSDLIVPPEETAAHLADMAEFKRTGHSPTINTQREIAAMRRDGTRIPIEVSTTGFHDGTAFISNAFIRDISDRKEAERQRERSEQRLQAITDNLPALITHVDLGERYTFVNSNVERVFGIAPEALIGRTMRTICGEAFYATLSPHIKACLAGQEVAFEGVVTTREGVRHFQANYIPEFNRQGEISGFYALTFDITERRRDELQRAESEARLRLLTDNIPALIAYVDVSHRFRFGNATFEDWLGVAPGALIGMSIQELVGEQAYRERLPYFERAFGGETVRFEMTAETIGIKRILQTVYVPHKLADGRVDGLYTISTDVTDLKKIEQELAVLARVDSLTDLPNRRQFEERMAEAVAQCGRSPHPMALMFLDIDKFKDINDRLGHAAGDDALQQFGNRVRSSVRKTDFVARLAGDEFMIIVGPVRSPDEFALVAEKILAAVRDPMRIGDTTLLITTSIGVAVFDGRDTDSEAIIARADAALYQAKGAGRNVVQLASALNA